MQEELATKLAAAEQQAENLKTSLQARASSTMCYVLIRLAADYITICAARRCSVRQTLNHSLRLLASAVRATNLHRIR